MKYRRSFNFLFLFFILLSVTQQQSNTCYVNCKQGYCSPTNAQLCTACDAGLLNINGACVAGSQQPIPITYWKPQSTNMFTDSINSIITCKTSNLISGTSSTLVYSKIPGSTFSKSFTIGENHQFIQVKFNAVILNTKQVPLLNYVIYDQLNKVILNKTVTTNIPSGNKETITCNGTQVQYVFFVNQKFSSNQQQVIIEIKGLDPAVDFIALSDFQIYYGNCNQECSSCSGSTSQSCLSCSGLYQIMSNGACSNCLSGFYDTGSYCFACPSQCSTCVISTSGSFTCTSCDKYSPTNAVANCFIPYYLNKMPETLRYNSPTGWKSSQMSSDPLSLCGMYSLIGGLSIGIGGSTLKKTFTQLPAHTQIFIRFTLFLIDQKLNQQYSYQVLVDGQSQGATIVNIVPASAQASLTNQCGGADYQMIVSAKINSINHTSTNATISIRGSANFFGIRDFVLGVNNSTKVDNCRTQVNGTCAACLYGFEYLNNTCSLCPDGYYEKNYQCNICPINCLTCQYNAVTTSTKCLSCLSPMVLQNNMCKDSTSSIYTRQIVPDNVGVQSNLWTVYPKLPSKGLDSCGNDAILGSSTIKYKSLWMTRKFNNLPPHTGVKLYMHFYQIDDYSNNGAVYFLLNGIRTNYTPQIQRTQLCGNSTPDAIVKVILEDKRHTSKTLDFSIHVDGMIKLGINNLIVFLQNCKDCNNQVTYKIQSIPMYSIQTPPQKGLVVKLLFDEAIKNTTDINDAIQFSISNPSSKSSRILQGLIPYGSNIPAAWESFNHGRSFKALLPLAQDYISQNIMTNPVNPFSISSSDVTDRAKVLSSSNVASEMPRYIDIDEKNNVKNRMDMRNLSNLFQGCAIFALWIGLVSFIFGMSSAFDDFFILVQVIFVHIFIQSYYLPPSLKIPLQGMQIVQFMAWLPYQARINIQSGILPNNLYQQSPIVYEQYWTDIVFVRAIYHVVLFIAFMVIFFIILKILSRIFKQRTDKKYSRNYFVRFYHQYQFNKLTYIDKVMRFIYFTIVWACILQFIIFSNSPTSFNIWNGILNILFFIFAVLYPILVFFYLRSVSNTISQATFDKNFQQLRVSGNHLYYFVIKYYKLLIIAILIGLLYDSNPLAVLIPLIFIHILDGIFILITKPFGMIQVEQLNVCFYNHYPKAYWITSAIQDFLFALLQIFIIILYGERNKASSDSYMGLGYVCCAIIILLLVNGLIRLVWGFFKIAQGCNSKSKQMRLQVQKIVDKQNANNQELIPIKSTRDMQNNLQSLQSRSRLNSIRKQSVVSKIN